ncbi:MAG TPA: pyridoxamine 5'-phosphate oxidase family protein [Thermomicrobiales bacterium]|jgi:PPOX class probable F420-dependent enzyme|nr:pyridoxamine 5'-phosphate oxidase family protein [Thermomicrobiales bacterium]
MTMVFNEADPEHQHALRRLQDDEIGWLGSVRPDGRPHTAPVWFFWHDGRILIFSEERTQKIRNLRHAGNVTLNLDSADEGEDIVIVEGTAEISDRPAMDWMPEMGEAYRAKYTNGLAIIGKTLEAMLATYTQVIIITPVKLIAWSR